LDDATDSVTTRNATEPRPSDDASYRSSYAAGHARPESRWWTFTLHRPRGSSSVDPADPPQLEKKPSSSKGRSKSWLISPTRERRFNENAYPLAGKPSFIGSPVLDDPMHWSRPPAKRNSITMAHTTTPGWDSPWTPRAPREGSEPDSYLDGPSLPGHDRDVDPTSWGKRKNRFRAFILSNPYVPLVSVRSNSAAQSNPAKVVPLHQCHLHNCRARSGDTNTNNRSETFSDGCSRQLSVCSFPACA
jgi:hypothetical protein